APVAPAVVGVGAWDHGGWQFWLAAIVAVVSSLLYAWAVPAAVWLLRVAVPLGTVPAIVEAPWPSVVVLICGVVVVTVAAWMPAATAVASSPSPVLPTPVRRSTGEATDAPR
ncbi:MAG: hypothetical protein KDB69_06295, partial [Acidimicrobiia bacterium]|nr:hypothetical protein [Acidimicrobiia bacterium]